MVKKFIDIYSIFTLTLMIFGLYNPYILHSKFFEI